MWKRDEVVEEGRGYVRGMKLWIWRVGELFNQYARNSPRRRQTPSHEAPAVTPFLHIHPFFFFLLLRFFFFSPYLLSFSSSFASSLSASLILGGGSNVFMSLSVSTLRLQTSKVIFFLPSLQGARFFLHKNFKVGAEVWSWNNEFSAFYGFQLRCVL